MTTNGAADGGERAAAAAAARGLHASKHVTTLDAATAAGGEFNKETTLLAVTMTTPASPEAGAAAHGESRCLRSRSSSWSSTCSSMGELLSREHVQAQGQILARYMDQLESLAWDDHDDSSVLGVMVEMVAACNAHVVDSRDLADDATADERRALQDQIAQEKRQIKALVQELFGQHHDADLASRLIEQLEQ
ncbi:Uncharacterized protein PBTT_09453 [Plasmodiophora brassicae]